MTVVPAVVRDRPRTAPASPRWSRAWWAGIVLRPTSRTAAAMAVVAVLALLLPEPGGLLVAASLLVAVAVDGARAPAPESVAFARHLPVAVRLGGAGELVWEVVGPVRATTVAIADELRPSFGAPDRSWSVDLAAGDRREHRSEFRPSRRGTVMPSRVTVRTMGPLGLATRQRDREVPGVVEIHPAFPSRDRVVGRVEADRRRMAGTRPVRELGAGTEFDSLREYRYGDDVRRVDWGATARVGHPVVRTHRAERDRPVVVLLEHGRASATRVAGVPRLDHLMDAAQAVTTAARLRGDRVGLAAYADVVTARLAVARSAGVVADVSRALHRIEPVLVQPDHRAALRVVAGQQRRRALLVLLTDLGVAGTVEELRAVIPVLAARHRVLVAGVVDPDLDRAADSAGSAGGDGTSRVRSVHRAGAAAEVLERRRRAAAQLRGAGAEVVDETPEVLPLALVDRYLGLAARGRI